MVHKEREQISAKIRKQVLNRDDYRCMKCGRRVDLQIHHICPVCCGGKDNIGNLITLCGTCHETVPDIEETSDFATFIRWFDFRFPAEWHRSLNLTKVAVSLLFLKYGLKEKTPDAEKTIVEIYEDLWKLWYSNDMDEFTKLMSKYSEEHPLELNSKEAREYAGSG